MRYILQETDIPNQRYTLTEESNIDLTKALLKDIGELKLLDIQLPELAKKIKDTFKNNSASASNKAEVLKDFANTIKNYCAKYNTTIINDQDISEYINDNKNTFQKTAACINTLRIAKKAATEKDIPNVLRLEKLLAKVRNINTDTLKQIDKLVNSAKRAKVINNIINLEEKLNTSQGKDLLDNIKNEPEAETWKDRFEAATKNGTLNGAWLNFYEAEFGEKNVETVAALGEAFQQEIINFGFRRSKNPFIGFVHTLLDLGYPIKHNTYTAIHNAVVSKKLSISSIIAFNNNPKTYDKDIIALKDLYLVEASKAYSYLRLQGDFNSYLKQRQNEKAKWEPNNSLIIKRAIDMNVLKYVQTDDPDKISKLYAINPTTGEIDNQGIALRLFIFTGSTEREENATLRSSGNIEENIEDLFDVTIEEEEEKTDTRKTVTQDSLNKIYDEQNDVNLIKLFLWWLDTVNIAKSGTNLIDKVQINNNISAENMKKLNSLIERVGKLYNLSNPAKIIELTKKYLANK